MEEYELRPEAVVLGERNYEAALDIVFGLAERELLVFDQHLRTGAYHTLQRFELIRAFLQKDPQNRLQIVLHEADYFTSHCPRLFDLLKTYGHAIQVLLTNDHARVAKDCFVVADDKHTVRRVHIDHARFKYTLDDPETAATLRQRFDEILAETTVPVTATTLGI